MHKRAGANKKKNSSQHKQRVGAAMGKLFASSRTVAIGLLVIGGGVFGAVRIWKWMQASPLFVVSAIRVNGTQKIDKGDVLKYSGLKTGVRITSVNCAAAKQAIAKMQWVKTVSVSRRFPSTIAIDIRERTPIALVACGRVRYLDETGVLMDLFPGTYSNLPVISGVKLDTAGNVEKESFAIVKNFLGGCENADKILVKSVSQIDFASYPLVRFSLDDMKSTIECSGSDYTGLMSRLRELASTAHNEGRVPKTINLCYANLAYVRY